MKSKLKKQIMNMNLEQLQDYIEVNPPNIGVQAINDGDNKIDFDINNDDKFLLARLFDLHHGKKLLTELSEVQLSFLTVTSKDSLTDDAKVSIIFGEAMKESLEALGNNEEELHDDGQAVS